MPPAIDFAELFEQSPNPYMLLDRQLRFVAANAAYRRETASTLDALLGRHVLEVFPNDPSDPNNASAALLRSSLEKVLTSGEADVLAFIPYRVPVMKDGRSVVEERFWSATHTPVRAADGQVAYVLQHTVDVTELHQLRHELRHEPADMPATAGEAAGMEAGVLRRAHALQATNQTLEIERRDLRSLFEQAPGFMCFFRGPDHVFEIANGAYYQLIGHRDIIGKSLRDALPEIASQDYLSLLDRVFTTGEPFVGRGMRGLVQRHPGGPPTEIYVDFSFQPILDSSGAVAGILTQGYDITAQKAHEAEHARLLARERNARAAADAIEERQRFLAESIPQQVWTARADGELDFVNGRVLAYFGAQIQDVLGSAWKGAVHPDDLAGCLERWNHSLTTGEEYEVEFRLRRADGTYRWHLGRALPFRGAEGRIEKWFGTNTDMDELTRARDELHQRAELDQQLIGIVSHDLRNPLNAIGLASALLVKLGRLDDQQAKIVARITSSSERATRLIGDFLDFTHARVSGQIPVTRRPANIRQIARQAFDEVHLAHPERPVTIEHAGEETGMWDPDRIAQLIGNLVSNAFQHCPASSAVRLSTRGSADEVAIDVHNDGAPIPPGDLGRLFEPFERGKDADSRSGRSVGLGLYISSQIAKAHGGTITVESAAGLGTRFIVRLPRESGTPADAADAEARRENVATTRF
jgi:PAS domain S-box-containing protein